MLGDFVINSVSCCQQSLKLPDSNNQPVIVKIASVSHHPGQRGLRVELELCIVEVT